MRRTLVQFGPILVVIAAVTLFYGAALGSPLTLHAMHTDDDVVWQFRTDTLEQFAYVQEHGYLPFWIDRRGLGQSAFVGSYHGNFYPLRWLALRLAPRAEEAADWLIWGHALVAGLATMALARHYGVSRWSAALAGIFLALGHLPVRWAPFQHAPVHFATYPLAVLGTELIWTGRARRGLALVALSLGSSGLGAHLQNTHMAFQVVGIVVLYRFLTTSVPWRTKATSGHTWYQELWHAIRGVHLQRLGLSVAAVLLGVAIAAPVLVPFVWEQRGTTREAVAEAGASGMNRASLVAHVDPRSPQTSNINDDVYMGPLAPALILAGLLVSLRRRRLAILPILVVLALLIGFKTPLLDVLQQVVPGWSAVSNVQRLSFVTVLPLALMAGLGLDWLSDRRRNKLTMAIFAALVGASLMLWVLRMVGLGRLAPVPVLWLGIVATLLIAFLLYRIFTRRAAATGSESGTGATGAYLPTFAVLGALVGASLVFWWLRMTELGLGPGLGLSPAVWLGTVATALLAATVLLAFLLYKTSPRQAAAGIGAYLPIIVVVFGVSLLAMGVERQLRWQPVPDKPLPEFADTLALVARHDDAAGRWMSFSIQMHESYMPNVFLEVPGRWLDTYESFRPPEFFTYWRTLTGSTQYDQRREGLGSLWYMHTPQDPTPNANLVNAAGITRILGSSDRVAETEQLGWSLLGAQGNLHVYHNPQAFPMAYGSRRWEAATPAADAIARLATAEPGAFNDHTDYVDGASPSASPGADPLPARVMRRSAEEVQVTLATPSRTPVLTVLLDSYHPDWQALVDGERRSVLRVNGVFRGVLLAPGETHVTFRYAPRWFPWLPAIAVAVALVMGLSLLPTRLRRRPASRVAGG